MLSDCCDGGRGTACTRVDPWWRHQMETFSALLALWAGNSSVTDEFPAQRSLTRSFDVLFDQRLNKQLRKQSWGWWFDPPSRSLWRQCHAVDVFYNIMPCQSIKQGVRCTVELEFSNALQMYLVDSFVTFKFCNRFGAFIIQRSSMHSPLAIMCKYDMIDRWFVVLLESICIWIYNYPCVF